MNKTTKFTLFQIIRRFLYLVCKSADFWRGMLLYSAVMTAFYHISLYGQYICPQNGFSCFMTLQIVIFAILVLIALCYIFDFYQSVFKNSVFKCKTIISFGAKKLKSVAFLTAYILTYIISVYIAKTIILKPANPVWQIEFIYFVIVFAVCLLPVFAMRFSAMVAFYLYEQKIPSFKFLFNKTAGHSFIGIVGFLGIVLILAIFNMQIYGYENAFLTKFPNSMVVMILLTFFDAFVKLFSLNVLVCFFEAQRELMEYHAEETLPKENKTISLTEKTPKKKANKKQSENNKKTR